MTAVKTLVEVLHWSGRHQRHIWVPGVMDRRRDGQVRITTVIGSSWYDDAEYAPGWRVRAEDEVGEPDLSVAAFRAFVGVAPESWFTTDRYVKWRDATAKAFILGGLHPHTFCRMCQQTALLGRPLVHKAGCTGAVEGLA